MGLQLWLYAILFSCVSHFSGWHWLPTNFAHIIFFQGGRYIDANVSRMNRLAHTVLKLTMNEWSELRASLPDGDVWLHFFMCFVLQFCLQSVFQFLDQQVGCHILICHLFGRWKDWRHNIWMTLGWSGSQHQTSKEFCAKFAQGSWLETEMKPQTHITHHHQHCLLDLSHSHLTSFFFWQTDSLMAQLKAKWMVLTVDSMITEWYENSKLEDARERFLWAKKQMKIHMPQVQEVSFFLCGCLFVLLCSAAVVDIPGVFGVCFAFFWNILFSF